ncbi:hypothetical protein FKM82_018249 [Ascaphus truei]
MMGISNSKRGPKGKNDCKNSKKVVDTACKTSRQKPTVTLIINREYNPDIETPKDFVSACTSDFYTIPFVDNMAGWSEKMQSSNPFPREGSFAPFHMTMIKGLCVRG